MIELEDKAASVYVDVKGGEVTANITPADNISVTVGQSAQIDVGAAVNYIESGKAEIKPLVDEAKYYAENVKFGMVQYKFTSGDWVLKDGKYEIGFNYDVVVAVYKANGDNYDLMGNIDIETSENTVKIKSIDAFDGYALLVNNAEKKDTFVYEQGVASDTWVIVHNMGKRPSVTVVDSSDTVRRAAVNYIDDNSCVVKTNGATTGRAYLN